MTEHTFESLGLVAAGADPATPVRGLAVDSREVKPGFLFIAIPGERLDGAEFAQYALRQGAIGVIATPAGLGTIRETVGEPPVPVFLSQNPRAELSRLAALWYPAQPETIAAITGTNGKTSTAHFLRQIWAAAGLAA
ncbi:MAG: Mur ligase domain-containing protein, partial [Pseudomonadota bacterium]